MAKKKQSLLEDLIDITSKFPWWVGALLAVIAYFLLHAYASKEITSPADFQHIGENFTNNLLRTLAKFGQYILPAVFLVGAIISAYERIFRQRHPRSGAASHLKLKSQCSINAQQSPICPKCGSKMILRTAQKRKNVGNQFWGCSNFPKCRSTMSLGK